MSTTREFNCMLEARELLVLPSIDYEVTLKEVIFDINSFTSNTCLLLIENRSRENGKERYSLQIQKFQTANTA